MGRVIAIVNEKGGVAKTTSTKNIAIGLANEGRKVLAIDTDPSTNLTTSLGIKPNEEIGDVCDIYEHFMKNPQVGEPKKGIYHQEVGIDVVPSSDRLSAVKKVLSSVTIPVVVLRTYINTIRDQYDYILIDCPAGSDLLPTNALFAADSLIIPMQPHALSVDALRNLLDRINEVRILNGTGNKPEILGVLFTMVRSETNNDRHITEWLKNEYGNLMYFFKAFIPQTCKLPESDLEKKSIFKYAPNSPAAVFYKDLIKEILSFEEK